MSWLKLLTESTKSLEPPKRFFYWSGLSTIASIVKANVFLDKFSYTLYPNIYVVLVSAKSGLRKGIPISYARSILKTLDCTRVISGQNSMPDILHELGKQVTTKTGKVYNKAQVLLCAPEFDAFILEDSKALPTLTDLYDTHQHIEEGWNKGLKSGSEHLKEPCINLLAASNEELLSDMIHQRDIKGGFIARTFIIHESKRQDKVSLMWRPSGLISKQDLAEPLKRLVDLKGEFSIPDSVRVDYDNWYKAIDDESNDPTGTVERIGDAVLKVAMLISLSKNNDLIIDSASLSEAIRECESTLPGIRRVSLDGKFELSELLASTVKILLDSPNQEIDRPKLLLKLNCEPMHLNRVLDQLTESEVIFPFARREDSLGRPRGPFFYKLRPEIYEAYKRGGI